MPRGAAFWQPFGTRLQGPVSRWRRSMLEAHRRCVAGVAKLSRSLSLNELTPVIAASFFTEMSTLRGISSPLHWPGRGQQTLTARLLLLSEKLAASAVRVVTLLFRSEACRALVEGLEDGTGGHSDTRSAVAPGPGRVPC